MSDPMMELLDAMSRAEMARADQEVMAGMRQPTGDDVEAAKAMAEAVAERSPSSLAPAVAGRLADAHVVHALGRLQKAAGGQADAGLLAQLAEAARCLEKAREWFRLAGCSSAP